MEFKVLTDKQIAQIHNASIRILETIGVRISHKEVLKKFKEAGADVDESKETVKIPEKLVNSYRQPSEGVMPGWNPEMTA